MNIAKAITGLQRFVRRLVKDGVNSKETWREWKHGEGNEAFMARCFGYKKREKMPSVTAIVQPFFHPSLPLIGLNYTQVAHVTLHNFGNKGWTPSVRLCRGIIFDHEGELVAMPFQKFFNYGEHPETRDLPKNAAFDATVKADGHLGIIFEFQGELYITTRGSLESKTSVLATKMLKKVTAKWKKVLDKDVNPLVEIIDPETAVHTDYQGWKGFILIGANNRKSFHDFLFEELEALGEKLEIKVAERWSGKSIDDLIALMKDHSVHNQEGYVLRFRDSGLRVKFKFATYIARMIGDKLDLRYVMRRIMDGTLEKRTGDLPGEIQLEAKRLRKQLDGIKRVRGSKKDRWQFLYDLESDPAQQNDSYKTLCRSYQAFLVRTGVLNPVK